MYEIIQNHNVSAHIEDNFGISSLKFEVKLNDVKVIPRYSWVDDSIACSMPHNVSGPAFSTVFTVLWYIHGVQYFNTEPFCRSANHTDETTLHWVLVYGDTLPYSPDQVKQLPVELKP